MSFKDSIDVIFLDFCKVLSKHGYLKEDVTICQILDSSDELKINDGFLDFAHYHLCQCQKKRNEE